ncbi:hypothetical protein [Mangrovibacillus cuniculi]|uniref:Uncharacterized protein n=1 Tax=Mangrovibacillus cuniculi TaxID=2593652 RepID=A0A7S8CCC0_9BACI|nr:hypothetical protein [Mangrovibacillus cuniculi]QPC47364.1 hypothetical protein G8O30_10595 [Mangrovibacillus cuniculi]
MPMYTSNQIAEILQKLQYIQHCIEEGTHKENSAIIHVITEEIIVFIRNYDFMYHAEYALERNMLHLDHYRNLANQEKARLLSDLEELQRELNKKEPNLKRSLVLVTGMIETELYKDSVQKKINKWMNLSRVPDRQFKLYTNN